MDRFILFKTIVWAVCCLDEKILVTKEDLSWLIQMTNGYIEDENLHDSYVSRMKEIVEKYGVKPGPLK